MTRARTKIGMMMMMGGISSTNGVGKLSQDSALGILHFLLNKKEVFLKICFKEYKFLLAKRKALC